jgi:hypothetical protein
VASQRVGAFRNASVPGCDNCVSVIDARIDLYLIVAAMKHRSVKDRAEGEGEMMMRALLILVTVCFSATAFAQSPPPKVGNKPLAQAKPQAPMGCKLVGTVKGTKLWAGDCADAAELRGAAPTAETAPPSLPAAAAGAIPPGQKQ